VRVERFPWAYVMRLGLGVLQLSPDVFWRMTLKELMAAFQWEARGLERARMEEMMEGWPDDH
jgi:uncharacterized phage protein (TIGR02216 family)